jgi:hypothetical protein
VGLSRLLRRKTQQEALRLREQGRGLLDGPGIELSLAPLNKHGHHLVPVLHPENSGRVGHIEFQLLAPEGVLEVEPSFEPYLSVSLLIVAIDHELLDISQAKVAGVQMLRHHDDGIFLFFHEDVDPHTFVPCSDLPICNFHLHHV